MPWQKLSNHADLTDPIWYSGGLTLSQQMPAETPPRAQNNVANVCQPSFLWRFPPDWLV